MTLFDHINSVVSEHSGPRYGQLCGHKIAPTEAALSPSARRSGCIVALLQREVKRVGEYYELKI